MGFDPFTKEDFLEIWRRVLPGSYTDPIENGGDGEGFDIPSLQAEIFARFETSLNLTQQSYYLKPHSTQTGPIASGARRATGSVNILRAAPADGEVIIPRGTFLDAVITDGYGDEQVVGRVRLTGDVTMPSGDSGPVAASVEAEFTGYAGNLDANLVTRFSELGRATVNASISSVNTATRIPDPPGDPITDLFSEVMVGRLIRFSGATLASETANQPRRITQVDQDAQVITYFPPLDDAADIGTSLQVEIEEYEDYGFTAEQPVAITGGVSGSLDAIGVDRRSGRVQGEGDEAYRKRLCTLDDIISPNAIERIASRLLSPKGIDFDIKETRDVNGLAGFIWDVHPYDFGSLTEIIKPGGSEYIGQGGVWVSEATAFRFFLICVEPGNQGEFGAAYDTEVPPQDDLPANAWDSMFYDGRPLEFDACIGQLYEAVDQARAAGVGFQILIELQDEMLFDGTFDETFE